MNRFGIIGTNWITERFIQAAKETGEFVLTAIYSRTEQKGNEFAAKLQSDAKVYTDLEAMCASDQVDAVYIASPNSFHAEQAVRCMKMGKHVLCEKPLASNQWEVKQMIEAARTYDVVFMEAMKSTCMPGFQVIKQHLHKIGTVRRYFASYCQYSSRYDAYKQGTILNAFNPTFSNGSLMDLGVYCIYPMAALFGKPDSVQATAVMLSSGVDGAGSMLMKYEEMDAVIMHSKIVNSYAPSEIQGEEGTMVIDAISQPREIKIHYKDGRVEDLTEPALHEPMYYEALEFIQLIKEGRRESDLNPLHTSLLVAEIMDEARAQIGLQYEADLKS